MDGIITFRQKACTGAVLRCANHQKYHNPGFSTGKCFQYFVWVYGHVPHLKPVDVITRILFLIELKPVMLEWNCSGVLSRSLEWKEKSRKSTPGLVSSWPGPIVEVNYVTSVNHPKQHNPFSSYRNCNVHFQKLQLSKRWGAMQQVLVMDLSLGYSLNGTLRPNSAHSGCLFLLEDADWPSHTSVGWNQTRWEPSHGNIHEISHINQPCMVDLTHI